MMDYEMTPEQIQEKIKNMVWSFSRVNGADKCRYAWYRQYVEEDRGAPNAYAQFGTICHKTLEKYLKGELDIFTVSQYYQDHYKDYVTCNFPPNKYVDLGEKAYLGGKEYFDNINFDFDRYEILGVEKELNFQVGKYPFHGFADAIYRDRETVEIILRDHKSSSFKYLKNGNVSSKDREHFKEFRYQEYLYSIPLIEEYGKVDYLSWNMIRDQREIKIPFDEKEFKEAQEWCVKTIEDLEQEMLWLPDTSSSYWCNTICSNRGTCPYSR
jgi:hypothetical protein